ncbi:MAG: hypothetical protein WC901_05370 [Candidatus Margulisiibacteriota bacterium]
MGSIQNVGNSDGRIVNLAASHFGGPPADPVAELLEKVASLEKRVKLAAAFPGNWHYYENPHRLELANDYRALYRLTGTRGYLERAKEHLLIALNNKEIMGGEQEHARPYVREYFPLQLCLAQVNVQLDPERAVSGCDLALAKLEDQLFVYLHDGIIWTDKEFYRQQVLFTKAEALVALEQEEAAEPLALAVLGWATRELGAPLLLRGYAGNVQALKGAAERLVAQINAGVN